MKNKSFCCKLLIWSYVLFKYFKVIILKLWFENIVMIIYIFIIWDMVYMIRICFNKFKMYVFFDKLNIINMNNGLVEL